MRELKFRAWDKDNKEMVYAGRPFSDPELWYLSDVNGDSYELKLTIGNHGDYSRKVDFELMQFTGLKDKNGKECYEFDIVQFTPPKRKSGFTKKPTPMVVIWHEKKARFTLLIGKGKTGELNYMNLAVALADPNHEIVGNRYENPELMK